MKPLTDRQRIVLRTIALIWSEQGIPPTYRDVMERLGFKSPTAVVAHVRPLIRKGLVVIKHGKLCLTQLDVLIRKSASDVYEMLTWNNCESVSCPASK